VLLSTPTVGIANQPGDLYSARGAQRPEAGTVPYDVYGPGLGAAPPVPGGDLPDPGGGLPPPGGGGRDPLTGFELVCLDVRDPDCRIARPVCGPDDTGFTTTGDDAADVPVGSSNCPDQLSRPVRGLNVPEACTYAYFGGDTTDPACRGTYGGPPLPNYGPFGNIFLQPTGSGDPSEPLLCRVARWIPGSGSPCETRTERWKTARNAELAPEVGVVLPGETKQHCDPADERGIQRCVACTGDSDGTAQCGEFVVKPLIDPALVFTPQIDEIPVYETDYPFPTLTQRLAGEDPQPVITQETFPLMVPGSDSPPPADAPPVPDNSQPAPAQDPPPAQQPSNVTPPGPKPPPPIHHPEGPGPTHAGGDPGHGGDEKKNYTRSPEPKRAGDPVSLGDGSLELTSTDLSFPGPARPLSFVRSYRSASRDRSALGSNWRHNWDVRLRVYDEQTIPPWLSPWCAGLPGLPTAVGVQWGDSSSELFLLDIGTRLYLPQAGSVATLAKAVDGWVMRFPDGRLLEFDTLGCLVADTDRFGNRFTIAWEPTPLGLLFDHFCSADELVVRNETLAARRNALLAWLCGAGRRPGADPAMWRVTAADFPLPAAPAGLRAQLEYARDYLLYLASLPWPAESIDGSARRRVTSVTDTVGRQLIFSYYSAAAYAATPGPAAFAGDPAAGLLERVDGPAGASVAFRYHRPGGYPAELNESFLTEATRTDAVPVGAVGLVGTPSRTTTYAYQWPTSKYPQYRNFAGQLETRFRDYYARRCCRRHRRCRRCVPLREP
jgi:hypothetical protein